MCGGRKEMESGYRKKRVWAAFVALAVGREACTAK